MNDPYFTLTLLMWAFLFVLFASFALAAFALWGRGRDRHAGQFFKPLPMPAAKPVFVDYVPIQSGNSKPVPVNKPRKMVWHDLVPAKASPIVMHANEVTKVPPVAEPANVIINIRFPLN